jgi:hypothetical protein
MYIHANTKNNMFVDLKDINERKRLVAVNGYPKETTKKRLCIIICIISMTLSIGVAVAFVGLSQNDTSNKASMYTKVQMIIFNYYAKREFCYSCPDGCVNNDYHYTCACSCAPWSGNVEFNYTAFDPKTNKQGVYFGGVVIDCGDTKALAINNALSDPYYKIGDFITGWYLNTDPSIYVLQDPTTSLFWIGFIIFTVIGLIFAVVNIVILFDRCRS